MRINRRTRAQTVRAPSRPIQCVIMWIMWCRVCPVGGARPFEERGARSAVVTGRRSAGRPTDPFKFLH